MDHENPYAEEARYQETKQAIEALERMTPEQSGNPGNEETDIMEATRTTKTPATHTDDARLITVPAGLLGELLREAVTNPSALIIPAIVGRAFWGDPDDNGMEIVDDSGHYRLGYVAWADLTEIVHSIRASRCNAVGHASHQYHRVHGDYPVKP